MRTDLTDLRRAAIDRALDQEAREIVQLLRDEYEGDADDLIDQLHEVVDGHEWIIYTAQAEAIVTDPVSGVPTWRCTGRHRLR